MPVSIVVNPPQIDRPIQAPAHLKDLHFLDQNKIEQAPLSEKIAAHCNSINFSKIQPLIEQYDSTVGIRTLNRVDEDAAVMRIREIKDHSVQIALTMDCNPRICLLDPKEGGRRAVVESALNLATRGAKPIGVTDCLNFGSPENPEVLWQFSRAIEGISEACLALNTPIVSGNVSFYNETDSNPIYPTPMIGMVGLRNSTKDLPKSHFYKEGLGIALLGPLEGELGGSYFAATWLGKDCGKPSDTSLHLVKSTVNFLLDLDKTHWEYAAHDISDGGLSMAVLEMTFLGPEWGAQINVPGRAQLDRFLFGESCPRILLAFDPSLETQIHTLSQQHQLSFLKIGQTTMDFRFSIHQDNQTLYQSELSPLKSDWQNRWKEIFA